MTQYIYMMVGAAGAGKSTFIKNFSPTLVWYLVMPHVLK